MSSRLRTRRQFSFVIGAAVPTYLALEGGGYDIVVRHEAGIVLWWGVALAALFGVIPVAHPSRAGRLVLAVLAGLIAWSALALLWTESDEATFNELGRLFGYAGVVLLVLLTVDRSTFRHAAAGLVLAALLIPALAVASRLAPSWFPDDSLARTFTGDRLLFPFGYWNALACWSAMAIAAGLAWSAHADRRAWHRRAALAAVPIAATALYLTYSRAGILLGVLGVVLVLALSRHRWTAAIHVAAAAITSFLALLLVSGQAEIANGSGSGGGWLVAVALAIGGYACWRVAGASVTADRLQAAPGPRRRIPPLALAAILLVALGIGIRVAPELADSFGASAPEFEEGSPQLRLTSLGGAREDLWAAAVRAGWEEPLTGIGPGSYALWWTRDGGSEAEVSDAHSLYLETFAELGIPGLLLVVALLLVLVRAALRARSALERAPDLGASTALLVAGIIYIVGAGVDWMWEMGAVSVLGLGALAVAGAAGSGDRDAQPAVRRSRGTWMLVCVAILAGVIQIPSLVSESRLRASEELLLAGDQVRARDRADDARAAAPWAASPRAQLALIALAGERLQVAREEIGAAIEREPTNWRHRFLQFRIELEAGDDARAADALYATVGLNPALADEAAAIIERFRGLNRP